MEKDLPLDIKLIQLINSFQNTIALNKLLIKEKIQRKLEMISTMRYYGFPIMNYSHASGNKIIDQLIEIDKTGDIVQYKDKTNATNKLLGDILHNAYQASGYNIILSNIPEWGFTKENPIEFIKIDSEAIYDTLESYIPYCARNCATNSAINSTNIIDSTDYTNINMVESILQISGDIYLAKIKDDRLAKAICNLLNNKMMERHIIKVEYIEPLFNTDANDIDNITNEKELNNYENNNSNVNKDNIISRIFSYLYTKIITFGSIIGFSK